MESPVLAMPIAVQNEIHAEIDVLRNSTIALLSVGFVCLALRVYVRARLIRAFGYDDWFMLLTYLLFFIEAWFLVLHLGFLPFAQWTQEMISQSVVLGYLFYYFCMISFKISLGLFFLRVFLINRIPRVIIYVVVALNIIFGIVRSVYVLVDQCHIISELIPGASSCTPSGLAFVELGVFITWLAALTDVVFAALALWAIRQMSLPRVEQVIAAILLLLGTMSGIFSFVRFAILVKGLSHSNNIVQTIMVARWSVIELGQGIIAASLATLRPLLREIYKQFHPSFVTPELTEEANTTPVEPIVRPRNSHRWTSDEFFLTMGRFKGVEAGEKDINTGPNGRRPTVISAALTVPVVTEESEQDLENGLARIQSASSTHRHLRNV